MAVWGAVMGGVNLLYQGAGWLEGGLTASFEKLILDAEILQMMAEVLQPIPVDEASLGFDAIADVGPGGHFFSTAAHARTVRACLLPAAHLRLAQLRDVAGRRREDRDRAREHALEAVARGARAAGPRPAGRGGARRLRRPTQARDRVGRRLEPQLVDVDDPILVVDDEGLAPELERRARVRDAEPDEVPDGQPGVAARGR